MRKSFFDRRKWQTALRERTCTGGQPRQMHNLLRHIQERFHRGSPHETVARSLQVNVEEVELSPAAVASDASRLSLTSFEVFCRKFESIKMNLSISF